MKNRRGIFILLAALLLCLLTACGGKGAESQVTQPAVSYPSADALNEAVGFVLTELPLEGAEGVEYTVFNGTLAQADYQYQGTTVEFRMSATEGDFEGMSGIQGGKSAGGVQWDDSAFSSLNVSFLEKTYYCEFSYQGPDGTLYYSLSQTDTDFAGFTNILRVLITQITEENQSEDVPDEDGV